MKCLPIIADNNTKILILGSFPGRLSLEKREYYANPHNHFWQVMSLALGIKLILSYEEKIRTLLENRIGLWNVIYSCDRTGSMDHMIRNERYNDFRKMKAAYPNISLILVSGRLPYKMFEKINPGYLAYYIDSTSAANTKSITEKAKSVKDYLSAL